MEFKAPQILEAAVEKCPDGESPIFYVDIKFDLFRGKTRLPFKAEKRVIKGASARDFKTDEIKRNALKWYFGYDRDKSQFKKVEAYDLAKIEIKGVVFRKFLGYGIKSS